MNEVRLKMNKTWLYTCFRGAFRCWRLRTFYIVLVARYALFVDINYFISTTFPRMSSLAIGPIDRLS